MPTLGLISIPSTLRVIVSVLASRPMGRMPPLNSYANGQPLLPQQVSRIHYRFSSSQYRLPSFRLSLPLAFGCPWGRERLNRVTAVPFLACPYRAPVPVLAIPPKCHPRPNHTPLVWSRGPPGVRNICASTLGGWDHQCTPAVETTKWAILCVGWARVGIIGAATNPVVVFRGELGSLGRCLSIPT